MTTTLVHPSVPPRERLWQAVEAAYAQVRAAQLAHGDTSPQARTARRAVSMAWIAYESSAYVGLPARPVIVHRPLVGETLVEIDVDVADIAYHLCLTLDGQGTDAAAVEISPEPAATTSIPHVAFLALGALADLEASAAGRGDVHSADVWSRTHVALESWRTGYVQAQAEDAA